MAPKIEVLPYMEPPAHDDSSSAKTRTRPTCPICSAKLGPPMSVFNHIRARVTRHLQRHHSDDPKVEQIAKEFYYDLS